jgi:hypothetical protein
MTVLHKLTAIDKEQRLQFALWAMEEEAVLHSTWFTDEANFHLNGVVNKQNVRFWARELPHTLHEKENYGAKVNVWTSGVPRNIFRWGSTNPVEDRGQKERGSGGGSPIVRGSGGSCNLV